MIPTGSGLGNLLSTIISGAGKVISDPSFKTIAKEALPLIMGAIPQHSWFSMIKPFAYELLKDRKHDENKHKAQTQYKPYINPFVMHQVMERFKNMSGGNSGLGNLMGGLSNLLDLGLDIGSVFSPQAAAAKAGINGFKNVIGDVGDTMDGRSTITPQVKAMQQLQQQNNQELSKQKNTQYDPNQRPQEDPLVRSQRIARMIR